MLISQLNNWHDFQARMQQELLSNPDMLRQVLDNPLVQQMMNDPENMRSLITSNPQMQDLMSVSLHFLFLLARLADLHGTEFWLVRYKQIPSVSILIQSFECIIVCYVCILFYVYYNYVTMNNFNYTMQQNTIVLCTDIEFLLMVYP